MDSSKQAKILIEICHNCKAHQWCTRHNEQTYQNIAIQVSKSIKEKIPNADISIEKVEGDKIGSFEIFCNSFEIFSKRALGYFPHAEAVTVRIGDFLDGKLHNRLSSPIKRRPQHAQLNSPLKKAAKLPPSKQNTESKPKKLQTPKVVKQQPKVEPKVETKVELKKQVKTPVVRKQYAPKPKKEEPKPEVPKKQEQPKKEQVKIQPKNQVNKQPPVIIEKAKEVKEQVKVVEPIKQVKSQTKVQQSPKQQPKVQEKKQPTQKVILRSEVPAKVEQKTEKPQEHQVEEIKVEEKQAQVTQKQEEKKQKEQIIQQPVVIVAEEQKITPLEETKKQQPVKVKQKYQQLPKQLPKQEVKQEVKQQQPKKESQKVIAEQPKVQEPQKVQTVPVQQPVEPLHQLKQADHDSSKKPQSSKRLKSTVRSKPKSQVDITIEESGQKQSATIKYTDFQKQVQKYFSKMDIDKNKTLESNEILQLSDWLMKQLQMDLSQQTRAYMDKYFMELVGKDNDGKMNIDEFKKVVWECLAPGEEDGGEEEEGN